MTPDLRDRLLALLRDIGWSYGEDPPDFRGPWCIVCRRETHTAKCALAAAIRDLEAEPDYRCPECHGTGYHESSPHDADISRPQCGYCDGTGSTEPDWRGLLARLSDPTNTADEYLRALTEAEQALGQTETP